MIVNPHMVEKDICVHMCKRVSDCPVGNDLCNVKSYNPSVNHLLLKTTGFEGSSQSYGVSLLVTLEGWSF